jgi:hypothetical protein
MRTVTATAPDGGTWDVRVVWQPRWRALARRFGGWRRKRRKGDGPDVDGGVLEIFSVGDDIVAALIAIVGLIVFGLLFWFLLLPLALLVVDIVVVLILLALAIPARILLRRPWTVEAVRRTQGEAEKRVSAQVVGWRNALRTRDEIADKLRAGFPASAAVAG